MYNSVDPEYAPILDILKDILGKYHMHNDDKGQISFDCPVCSYDIKCLDHGDGKGNLEVNYKDEVFKCWSCAESHETHGSLYRLIKKFGTQKQLKRYEILINLIDITLLFASICFYLLVQISSFISTEPSVG